MTICIAAIAANRSAVIVTSDRMLSAHFLSLEFDHPDSKIEKLGKSCVGLSSGDALPAGELFASAHSVSTQLQNPQVGQIAESIKDAYATLRARRVEEQVFRPRGITLDAFYQQGLIRQFPPEVAMQLDDMVQRAEFRVELVIAGVDGNGAHIIGISDPGRADSYDRVGYHAIGSGMSHAILSLVSSGQHWAKGINETVFNVFRAKRQAETAPGVGRSIEIRIVTNQGTRSVTDKEMKILDDIYTELLSPQDQKLAESIVKLPFNGGKENEQEPLV